jgi:sucrose-6-phosphate hydrolase SacC (GH32 family)
MLALPDSWVWDFWTADDGTNYHLFFLYASKALHDPTARHRRASIGHAVSTDLISWRRIEDALVRSDPPAFDDLATWTGSVIQHPDGTWFMFYTGTTLTRGSDVQSIGYATSPDLVTWQKAGQVAAADTRWYEVLADQGWYEEAFRDPWVMRDPDGNGWHLLVTARSKHGPVDDRGVVGHCWSPDLRTWEVREPLSAPGQGFGHLEVMHTAVVDGQPFLVFSCLASETSVARRAKGGLGGTWAARGESLTGPYDIANAQLLNGPELYVGRLVQSRDGLWHYLAFANEVADGGFGGTIIDPLPVRVEGGRLVIERASVMPSRAALAH